MGSCTSSTCATSCKIGCYSSCHFDCGKSCHTDCIGTCSASCEYGCGEACTGMVTKSTYRTLPVIAVSADPEPDHVVQDPQTTQTVYNQPFANTPNAVNIDPDYYTKFNLKDKFGNGTNARIEKNDTVKKAGYFSGPDATGNGYPTVKNV